MSLNDVKETDLHAPVAGWLTEKGCEVQAEINDIDVLGVFIEESETLTIGVELKKTLNLEVIAQAVQRQKVCDVVYIAVVKQKGLLRKTRFKRSVEVLKRLNIGLLLIDFSANEISLDTYISPDYPAETRKYKKPTPKLKKKLLKEFNQRELSVNVGGSTRKKQMTAYKETCYEIAKQIATLGIAAPKDIINVALTSSQKSQVLTRNYYGWFEKIARGQYKLTPEGYLALEAFEILVTEAKLGKVVKCDKKNKEAK